MTERDYQNRVVELARTLGYRVVHAPNARTKSGRWSNQGITDWPDLTLIRPPRIIFAELKGAKTPLRAGQANMLGLLLTCHQEAYLWRAGIHSLQDIADILARKAA